MDYPQLTFEQPDLEAFRNLQLAFDAGNKGGNAAAILNAANEVAVARFLNDEVSFTGMTDVLEHAMASVSWQDKPDLEALVASDAEARALAREFKA
jgi:1-deoxy-D-xylulose-5-phosphate reductoisomerase